MNWLRTLLLTAVATLAIAGPGFLASTAEAHPAQPSIPAQSQARYYYVFYRSSPQDAWHYYGYTPNANDAAYYVQWIQYYGYQAFYR